MFCIISVIICTYQLSLFFLDLQGSLTFWKQLNGIRFLKYFHFFPIASPMAQLLKNPPAMQDSQVQILGLKMPWSRERPPTPVFLGFPHGSAGKESACNAGDLGSIPGLGRLLAPVFWAGEFHGLYSQTQLSHFPILYPERYPCVYLPDY